MDRVAQTREEIVIAKHGKPVARYVPARELPAAGIFGCTSGAVQRMGDIVNLVGEGWDAERG